MKKDHVVLDFVRDPIPQKIETGHNVEAQMRQNPIFVKSDVPVDDLKLCNDLLQSRYVASIGGGKEETILLHQAEEAWVDKMRKIAMFVDRIADGDGAVIVSAGFNLAKQRSASSRPEFCVEMGERSGSVSLRRQRIDGARSYIWQCYIGETPGNEAEWVTVQITSQASVELTGLKPLTKYWFRVAAVTIQGTTAFCSPIMQVVI